MSKKICVFGDSITRGTGDLPEQGGWAGRLGRYVKDNNYHYNIIN